MLLRVVGFLGVFLVESGAFLYTAPTRPSILAGTSTQIARLGAGAALGGGANEDGDERAGETPVPCLVVMDLDDTLW